MHQYLSFNDPRFTIPGFAEEESEDIQAALREPMPLKRSWTLWEQMSTGGYSTRKVVSFSTAQEFWTIWNGVPQPSELLDGKRFTREQPSGQMAAIDALMLFQESIMPEWEDSANAQGGHFQIQLKPPSGGGQIDEYWNNLVLAIIGETMDAGHVITGVRLVDKLSGKGKVTDMIRIELWYHSKTTGQENQALKKSMEKMLTTRIDGSQGPQLKGDAIQDKKHNQSLSSK
mmetsp:Transcript_74407/g.210529  ORF Transcript_74407/g.210529 Transcript_74407/m.210529 type:complete len:230 (-) Transcript_74407:62-751(-)|eukprot:CAMPEP_0168420532 /NCGR_PEP_ID=MMETSP0228-20121227/32822_1 /TAXON_ID=133427 /ORGANISM="Protoceratium reticulatum, Strain CCCM 535 (=CCMP 1889)" /LENGTH=229 /DNA_ID=CAMNT_0008434427 /DNA_START=50 /DNA_END=739 /DNA_ORIENTATION=-